MNLFIFPWFIFWSRQEITRGASDVNSADIANINNNKRYGNNSANEKRRDSRAAVGSNSSSRRGSVLIETEEDLERKKLRAVLEMMGLQKKQQKEFTWDTVVKKEEPEKNIAGLFRR